MALTSVCSMAARMRDWDRERLRSRVYGGCFFSLLRQAAEHGADAGTLLWWHQADLVCSTLVEDAAAAAAARH